MSTKTQLEEQLQQLLPIYRHNKREQDSYKKIVDKYGTQIKSIMTQGNISEFIFDGSKATCTTYYKEEFIEEALIDKIKELGLKDIIKKKEYVDMDALENAIYNGELNAAQLASCQERKPVTTLRIVDIKK